MDPKKPKYWYFPIGILALDSSNSNIDSSPPPSPSKYTIYFLLYLVAIVIFVNCRKRVDTMIFGDLNSHSFFSEIIII